MNIYQSEGYYLTFTGDEGNKYNHVFCGVHNIANAECPNCNKPLLRFLTIDTADSILEDKSSIKFLHLCFCWTCNVSQGDLIYRITGPNSIELLKYEQGGAVDDFPYENYPLFFPEKKVAFKKIDKNIQKLISDINHNFVNIYDFIDDFPDITTPQHQVGGEPLLRQSDLEDCICPICSQNMPLIATISDAHPDNLSFADNEYVQVLYFLCPKCSVVGARQFCD